MADRPFREEVPPLLERWKLLVQEDMAAHVSWRCLEIVTTFAVSLSAYCYFSDMDVPPCLPYFWRGLASFAALQLELLIVLDYRNLAQQQVSPKHAACFVSSRIVPRRPLRGVDSRVGTITAGHRSSSPLRVYSLYCTILFAWQKNAHNLLFLLPQVTRVAARRDPGLSVSYALQLSSPELQNQYDQWMGRIPAMKWYPHVALAIQLVSFLRPLLGIEKYACRWVSRAADMLATVLMAARVLLDMGGAPKKVLSFFSVLAQTWINALNLGLVTSNDPCTVSLGPPLGTSLPSRAFYAAALTTTDLALMVCTMEHLALQSLILGLLLVPVQYILYLQQNGGISLASDPCGCGFYTISFATLATLLVAVYTRYAFTKTQVISFLNSIN